MCRGELQTRTYGQSSSFYFTLNLFPFPPLETTDCSCDGFLTAHSLVVPSDRPLVKSWESQSLAAATIPQRFGHCTCSNLKYLECTKYVRVQAWTRACEQSVYVLCVPGWFIKWVVIVMVMCYLHQYQTSTRISALINQRFLGTKLGIIKYKQNIFEHSSIILLRCTLTLLLSTTCFDSTSHLQVIYFFLVSQNTQLAMLLLLSPTRSRITYKNLT